MFHVQLFLKSEMSFGLQLKAYRFETRDALSSEAGIPWERRYSSSHPITINKLDGYDDTMQEYTYYAQIKVAEKDPHVQYVGVYEGVLDTDGIVTLWTPEQAASDSIMWRRTYGTEWRLTNPGPVLLVLIN